MREEQDKLADVVTGNMLVFSFFVYVLLVPGSILYFVTPLLSSKFDLFLEILHETFLDSTPIRNNVMVEGYIEISK